MAIALLSLPTTHQSFFSLRPFTNTTPSFHTSTPLFRCSSNSIQSSSAAVEDGPSTPSPESGSVDADDLPIRGCKACGREEIERGCNGEGRIQGGIATVPGFGWWPIKAYRPCPGFVSSGGRYRRKGQSMDEVVSGSSNKG
ncbi:uncharacterized protein [Euphorbia lathyris]|uniref:uncharacterized protein isoform X2 n=1 Tax=Euphorbia lathyris TaxID=212925 RepID=UPI0033137897